MPGTLELVGRPQDIKAVWSMFCGVTLWLCQNSELERSTIFNGKTMGKPWENHGKTMGKW